MIEIVLLGALGVATAVGARSATRGIFEHPTFERRNYRDHALPTAVGILVPVATAAVVGGVELVADPWRGPQGGDALDLTSLHHHGGPLVALLAGFGVLGLLDDLAGVGQSGGFRGHLRALTAGRLTSGGLKLVGGGLVALAVVGSSGVSNGRVELVRDAAVVALSANLVNLFDRAPGRAVKVALVWFAVLVALAPDERLAPVAIAVGAAAGLLRADLREELMVGDAGANAVGAALGYGLLLALSDTQRWIALGVVAAFNLASEVVSFGSVIDRVGALRYLDRLGRS